MTAQQSLALTAPGQDLGAYIRTINHFPTLSAEEENSLARRFYDEGDLEAARQLVLSHLRFVVHVARNYSGYGLPQADLIQEGNIGLLKAVKRFDPHRGVRLITFAVHWIKAEIHEFILRNWRIVRVATTKAQRKLFFNLRQSQKQLGNMSLEQQSLLANKLGVAKKDVSQMAMRMRARDLSFDPQEDEDSLVPADYLVGGEDPAGLEEEEDWKKLHHARLHSAMEGLDARSQEIIRQRWLKEPRTSLQVLGDQYQISAERIRQLERAALEKIRAAMQPAAAGA